jgi:hypothetical protein
VDDLHWRGDWSTRNLASKDRLACRTRRRGLVRKVVDLCHQPLRVPRHASDQVESLIAVSRLSAAIPRPASRRTTAPRPASWLSRADVVLGKAAEGFVNWCGWHGMQGVRGSNPLSSTAPFRVRCARCVPAALTGGRGLAAKPQVSRPTRDRAPGPSQGGSAGSNPVGGYYPHTSLEVSTIRRSLAICSS